ncbi:30S ribosomal protein S20 [Candidatus Wolfebacteria bacterium]|nr:30S ribosomal protein S20 [Candidatus Wolfebacteria bacterium]
MAIKQSAKKALRVSARKRVFNLRRTRTMRDAIKDVVTLVGAGEPKEAAAQLPAAYKAIDKAAKRGIIKKNTAARKKSRLARSIAKLK